MTLRLMKRFWRGRKDGEVKWFLNFPMENMLQEKGVDMEGLGNQKD